MRIDLPLGLLLGAVVANAVLVGASLNQSIKQLPARRRIGAVGFSAYSQAADLANGRWWYGGLGVGTALATLAAAIAGLVRPVRVAADHPCGPSGRHPGGLRLGADRDDLAHYDCWQRGAGTCSPRHATRNATGEVI